MWKIRENTKEQREWFKFYEEECAKYHEGSARKMFLQSEEKYEIKYGNYIEDGDSKTFKAILDINPYEEEFQVQKSEYIGHVEKGMGTRMPMGTDARIKKLQSCYGLAIRRNVNSVPDMKNAIWATYYHLCSTDENPRHEYCLTGEGSWCKWKKAEVYGTTSQNLNHPPPLYPDVQQHILPIFEKLSNENLLHKCLGGQTQAKVSIRPSGV
nr:PREDICTED: uncharacterized protein LOC105663283 [Megachile rotundata]